MISTCCFWVSPLSLYFELWPTNFTGFISSISDSASVTISAVSLKLVKTITLESGFEVKDILNRFVAMKLIAALWFLFYLLGVHLYLVMYD